MPPIAENGAVVPIRLTGEKDIVSSLAIFVEQNKRPLAITCTLHEASEQYFHGLVRCDESGQLVEIDPPTECMIGPARAKS